MHLGRFRATMTALLGVMLILLLLASAASANTVLHVSATKGHDTGNCQSSPCKTLGYAITQGRAVPDLITIEAGPGRYSEDLALGSADSGLRIVGAGTSTNPATSTILTGVSGNPTLNADSSGASSSLGLTDLRIVNPPGDADPVFVGDETDLELDHVRIDAQGIGPGIIDGISEISLIDSPVTLANPADTNFAVGPGGSSVTLQDSPILVAGQGAGVQNGGGPVSVTKSAITLESASGSGTAIDNGGARVTVVGSPIMVKGGGSGITNGGAPVTVTNSPITLANASGSANAIQNGGKPVTVSGSPIVVKGTGAGISNGGAPVSVTDSPIKLQNAASSSSGIANGGQSVTVVGSSITVQGSGDGISNGGAPVTVKRSPITLATGSGTGDGIYNGGQPVTIAGSPIVVEGDGNGINNGGAPVSVTGSPITLTNSSGSGAAIYNPGSSVTASGSALVVKGTGDGIIDGGGSVTLRGSPISLKNATATNVAIEAGSTAISANQSSLVVDGLGNAISNSFGTTALSHLSVTMNNSSDSAPAITLGGPSSLSEVTLGGAWSGSAIDGSGSLAVADSKISSGGSPSAPLLTLQDGSAQGHAVSITRSVIRERSSAQNGVLASNVAMAVDSSALLGGSGLLFQTSSGAGRTLTVASSTIDAGAVGVRNAAPVKSLTASADNSSGSTAIVNVEGSILVEPPAAVRSGTNGTAVVNCSHTEVPNTTQTASASLGTIECATGTRGNTFTPSLAAIFAHPGSGIGLNPHWNGVDSVPASAISLPAPFTDSSTDLLGHPRVQNGRGTCQAAVRDKGAVELTGHSGVVPSPKISGPSEVRVHTTAVFTASASNEPSGVSLTVSWHSSDGATATGKQFSHKFARKGKFTVSATVTGAPGCRASVSKQVTVKSH